MYVPSARHTHQLNEKDEFVAAGYAGSNGTDVQLAYAATDHIGILAAVSFRNAQHDEGEFNRNHRYGELGMQYHYELGEMGRVEFITGYGRGSSTSDNFWASDSSSRDGRVTGDYHKIFLQPNIGLESSWVETGLALRIGYVGYLDFRPDLPSRSDNTSATFFEPAFYLRLGSEDIKVEGQVGYSSVIQREQDLAFGYEPLFVSLGMHLRLSTIFR
ncbi:MAG: hypothetical protein U5J63_11775 [Fodinibius sp.]|nr:hypothetical protein [Fodinibius sp.]